MRMLKGTDFGTDKNSLLLLYTSLIRSKIDYGAQVYSCAKKTHLNKLDTVQNTALRLALGPFIPHLLGTWRWRPVYYPYQLGDSPKLLNITPGFEHQRQITLCLDYWDQVTTN
jgi:hypothetical protein